MKDRQTLPSQWKQRAAETTYNEITLTFLVHHLEELLLMYSEHNLLNSKSIIKVIEKYFLREVGSGCLPLKEGCSNQVVSSG